jgi:outer membrane biosynthesis protein TonB
MPKITRPAQPALFADTTTAPEATVTAPAKTAKKTAKKAAAPAGALARVTEETPAAAPVAATPDRRVRLGDLVVATAGSRYDGLGLFEAPRATDAEDTALDAVITRDREVPGLIYAQDVDGVLVVVKGRRRTQRASLILGDDHEVLVRVVSGYGTAAATRLEAHAENSVRSPPNAAALARDVAAAEDEGVERAALVAAVGGMESRLTALLKIARAACPAVMAWLEDGTLGETPALVLVEGSRDHSVQQAAVALLGAEIQKAIDSKDGKSAGLTGSRKGDAIRDPETGDVRVTRSACAEAIARAAAAAGAATKRQPKAAKPAAPAPAPAPVPVEVAQPVEPEPKAEEPKAEAPQPAPAPAPAQPKPSRTLTGSVTAAAEAALARSLAANTSTLDPASRSYLAGLRAALRFLTTAERPQGVEADRYGSAFSLAFE